MKTIGGGRGLAVQLIALVALVAGLAGCKTPDMNWACEQARAAYEVYLAILDAGEKPTKEQIAAARVGAALLAAYCGDVPRAERGKPPGPKNHPVDENGVLILNK